MKTETIEIVDCGRGPQLSTTRITVLDIFYWHHRGYSWDEIRKEMPSLSREELDVVIEYISKHHDELVERDNKVEAIIQQRIADQHARPGFGPPDPNVPREERIARMKEKLRKRVAKRNGEGHPD